MESLDSRGSRAIVINLDTNVFISAIHDTVRPSEMPLLDDFWMISDIVLWEIGHLEREGRIKPVLDTREFVYAIGRIRVFPVEVAIARALKRLDFRSDPADEIIAATSIVHDVPLLTRDTRILGSKVVPLALR